MPCQRRLIPVSITTAPVAFWLLPGVADAASLQARIRDLARDNGTDDFEPHVTLHADSCCSEADLEAVLRKVAAAAAPLTLGALATADSAVYFKALYVDFHVDIDVDVAGKGLDAAPLLALRRRLVGEVLQARASRQDNAALTPPAPRDLEQALAGYTFLPHLSLLYGNLPPPLRRRLAAANDLRGRSIRFDRIAAVRPAAGHADLSKVSNWEVFGHQRLGG